MRTTRKTHKGHRPRAGRGLAQELTAVAKALRNEGVSEGLIEMALLALCGVDISMTGPLPSLSLL